MAVRKAGGTVVYDPGIWLTYFPRDSFRRVFVQYYRYGLNKAAVARKHRQVVSARSLVPLAFVGSLAGLGAASAVSPLVRKALAAEVGLYGACALAFGVAALRRRKESLGLLPPVAAIFPVFHVAHGLGGIHGRLWEARRR